MYIVYVSQINENSDCDSVTGEKWCKSSKEHQGSDNGLGNWNKNRVYRAC